MKHSQKMPPCSTNRSTVVAIWRLACVLLPLFVLYPPLALAANEDDKPAAEADVQFPPFPRAENMIPFTVSATTRNEFMIDGESLSVSHDGTVRYTLVIVSPAGARNITYEAMRCKTAERRLYAVARADDTWAKARSDKWVRIRESTLNRHHAALFGDYFCFIGASLRDADDARRILRTGGNRSTQRP